MGHLVWPHTQRFFSMAEIRGEAGNHYNTADAQFISKTFLIARTYNKSSFPFFYPNLNL